MSKYDQMLADYQDSNKERFNKSFIMSKNDRDLLPEVTNIFKSLEIIKEIHVQSVTLDKDEENFGPIKMNGKYYKMPSDSRMEKIHYVINIDGRAKPLEKDLFMLKLLDNDFYVNDDVRYFPVWQVIDNLSYTTNNGVSIKSMLMPITLIKNDYVDLTPCFGKAMIHDVPNYYTLIFSKNLSPIFYMMLKLSLDSLEKAGVSPLEDFDKFETYQDASMLTKFAEFMGIDVKFSDDPAKLKEANHDVFCAGEGKFAFSLPDSELLKEKGTSTSRGRAVLGMLGACRLKDKNKFLECSYNDLITPWYWINQLIAQSGFSKSSDPFKRFTKARGVAISLSRVIDDQTREMLPIPEEDKENVYTVIRYIMYNFNFLFSQDPQDLNNKRIRLYEYILYPLRVYFSQRINRLVNQQIAVDADSIEKIFSSLNPMYLIQNLIKSRCLRTYNASNEYNLFPALLKGTFKGPQALGKGVSLEQRNLYPNYVGKIGLVAASPDDPGTTFTLSPFVDIYPGGYFSKNIKN
jgi:hypothetical protein